MAQFGRRRFERSRSAEATTQVGRGTVKNIIMPSLCSLISENELYLILVIIVMFSIGLDV